MVLTWNREPSTSLSYSSWAIDEENRRAHSHKITDTERFTSPLSNGNLTSLIPNVDDDGVRTTLPRHYAVDTNTRTAWHDSFYNSKPGISDFIKDPHHTSSAVKALPHVGLNELAPTDPRIRKMAPAYEPGIGPGYYNADPLGEQATGTLTIASGEVHHAIAYARDPTRPSASFASPERGHTGRDIADARVQPAVSAHMSGPDWGHWQSKGCWMPRSERRIEADRWGPTAREMRPPAKDRTEGEYSPTRTASGLPNSCEAYSRDPASPSYKKAFASAVPRCPALPGGHLSDTRLPPRPYESLQGTGAGVGPGSYNPEAPRLNTANVAYDSKAPYYSLASGMPVSPRNQPHAAPRPGIASALAALGLSADGTRTHGSVTGPNGPPSPTRFGGTGVFATSKAQQDGPSAWATRDTVSAPCSPSAAHAAAVMAEHHAAVYGSRALQQQQQYQEYESPRLSQHPPSPLGSPQPGSNKQRRAPPGHSLGWELLPQAPPPQQYVMQSGGGALDPSTSELSPTAPGQGALVALRADQHTPSSAPCLSPQRARSAPIVPRAALAVARDGRRQFSKLVFMHRHTPSSSILKSQLKAAADVRAERRKYQQQLPGRGG